MFGNPLGTVRFTRFRSTLGFWCPFEPSPITTERQIDDLALALALAIQIETQQWDAELAYHMIPTELLGKIAIIRGQMHRWLRRPLRWVGVLRVYIARNLPIFEIPHLDRIGFEQQHIISVSIIVEGLAEGVGAGYESATFVKLAAVKALGVAVMFQCTTFDVHGAICARVEGLNACGGVVDILDKVDFRVFALIQLLFTSVDPTTCCQHVWCLLEKTH